MKPLLFADDGSTKWQDMAYGLLIASLILWGVLGAPL